MDYCDHPSWVRCRYCLGGRYNPPPLSIGSHQYAFLGMNPALTQSLPAWSPSEDFKKWAKDMPPEANRWVYWDMVREREHATRLEF